MKQTNSHKRFDDLKCCVLIPTFNNAQTLEQLILDVSNFTSNIIIVNDGSTDGTGKILQRYSNFDVLMHEKNKGKGMALRNGIQHAYSQGFENLISIDSDGQHMADDLPLFLDKLEECGPSFIVGARNLNKVDISGKSSFANNFSNFWYRIETGLKMPDTQSGYRLYPLKLLAGLKYFTGKYEFELEVLARAAWRDIHVTYIPIQVYYAPREKKVSHFRPFKDFTRISIVHFILVNIKLFFINPRDLVRNIKKKGLKEVLKSNDSNAKLSAAIGFGLFMGVVPVWGYQMILAAAIAHLVKLNKVIVLLASNISIPPMIPVIVYSSYKMGALFVKEPVVFIFNKNISLQTIKVSLLQYIYGSFALAVLLGAAGFFVAWGILSVARRNQHE